MGGLGFFIHIGRRLHMCSGQHDGTEHHTCDSWQAEACEGLRSEVCFLQMLGG